MTETFNTFVLNKLYNLTKPYFKRARGQDYIPGDEPKTCASSEHMTEDDSWILENQRREIEMEIKRRIEKETEVVQWFEVKGLEKELELAAVKRMGVVGEDGVHLSEDMCRSTAVNLCFRVAEADVTLCGEGDSKRQRRY